MSIPSRQWAARAFALSLITGVLLTAPESATAVPQGHVTTAPSYLTAGPTDVPLRPVRTRRVKTPSNTVMCLAQVIYFEARHEPVAGMEAVAATVFNRMSSKHYPKSVCGVVYQPAQYSWTVDASKWTRRPPAYYVNLAQAFLDDQHAIRAVYPVTHFHHTDIHPRWSRKLAYWGTVGHHRFYAPSTIL